MTKQNSSDERTAAAMDLALLRKPVSECLGILKQYEWDFEGSPFVLTQADVVSILERYLQGKLTEVELESWADAVELREDIDYEENDRDWIADVVASLASPEINGAITHSSVSRYLKYISSKTT